MFNSIQKYPRLTTRQEEVLSIIVSEIENSGFPPTVREIQEKLGVKSIRGASVHLDALQKKGFIQITGKARGIKVLRKSSSMIDKQEIRIPLIGQVQAGIPIWAEENFEQYINVKTTYLKGYQKAYALRVKGESMIGAGIEPDDVALIYPTNIARDGDIVVALIDNEVTLKRFQQVDNFIALLPANENFQPIIGKDFDIQGKLIGLIKKNDRAWGSLVNEAKLIPIAKQSALDHPNYTSQWTFGGKATL